MFQIPYENKLIRAFSSKLLKKLAFTISKTNFITYNTPLYNIPYIKTSIFLTLHLNILALLFFIHFYYYFSLLLCLSLLLSLHLSSPGLEASPSIWYLLSKPPWPELFKLITSNHNHSHSYHHPKKKTRGTNREASPSLWYCSQNLHGLSFSSSSPLTTTTTTTTNHNLNP